MKITGIETLRLEEFPNLLWVQVHTDQGLVGLGESFYGPDSAEGHIHSIIAAYLLGQDPLLIDRHHANLIGYVGFNGSSAGLRATHPPAPGRRSARRHSRLQHLRRIPLRAQQAGAGHRQLRARPGRRTL
jgi:hypothetical protein